MRFKRNVRYTSRSKLLEKSPAFDLSMDVVDDSWDIFKENLDNYFVKQCFTSYLMENISGLRQEVTPSPHHRRICPLTIEDYEE